jgi:hypothetical protein
MDWEVIVVKTQDGTLAPVCRPMGFVVTSEMAWHRGGYPEIAANNLVKTLKEFSQEKLAEFVKAMNKPAEVVVFKEKKP